MTSVVEDQAFAAFVEQLDIDLMYQREDPEWWNMNYFPELVGAAAGYVVRPLGDFIDRLPGLYDEGVDQVAEELLHLLSDPVITHDLVGVEPNPGPNDTMKDNGGIAPLPGGLIEQPFDYFQPWNYGPNGQPVHVDPSGPHLIGPPMDPAEWASFSQTASAQVTPSPPLVGIEPNPGPDPKKKVNKAAIKKASKSFGKKKFNYGSNLSTAMVKTTPAAYSMSVAQPTFITFGKPQDVGYRSGVRVSGRQAFLTIGSAGADTNLFITSTATANSGTTCYLSPDNLNGRLARQSDNWSRYAIRALKLTFVPTVASTQAGSFVWGVIGDSNYDGFSDSFASISELETSCIATVREPCSIAVTYTGRQTWFTKLKTTASADIRLSVQYALKGLQGGSGGAVTYGYSYVDYIIDFYEPSGDLGETLLRVGGRTRVVPPSRLSRLVEILDEPPTPRETQPVVVDMQYRRDHCLDPNDLGGGMHAVSVATQPSCQSPEPVLVVMKNNAKCNRF